MPYKDPNSPEAIASRERRQRNHTERRKKLREEYLNLHPELRPKKPTPESEYLRYEAQKERHLKYKVSPSKNREASLKCRFGITSAQYDEMIRLQGNLCLLCKRPLGSFGLKGDSPALDHCHETEVNRGIIHRKCNVAIGMLDDNPVLLRLAVEYLEKFQ